VQRKSVLFGFNPVLFGLGRDEMKRVLSTEKIWSTWYATEYPELAYQKQGERNWRFIDTSTGNAVGKSYPTCASLRMNIRRYAILFGCVFEMEQAPPINQVEMTEADIEFAERIAKRLGFTQTAYTSSSALWGLFCLPDHAKHRHGCIIKTKEFGFLFVADLEDMQMHDLFTESNK
jgi:hypothetical protein